MKTVCKKLLCLMLVAMLLVSAVPAAFADGTDCTIELWVDGAMVKSATQTFGVEDLSVLPDESFIGFAAQQWTEIGIDASNASVSRSGATIKVTIGGATAGGTTAGGTVSGTIGGTTTGGTTTGGTTTGGETDACAHTNTETANSATCEAGGYVIVRCSDCGVRVSTTEVAALGHSLNANGECERAGCDYVKAPEATQTGSLIITIYKWIGNERTQIGEITLPAGIYTLDDEFAASAYPAQKIKYDWGSRNGMVVDATKEKINVALSVTPLETSGGKNVYKLRVYANDGTSNYKQIDIYEGEGILAAIKNAGITPKYEDHVLVGYLNNHTGNASTYLTIYDVADGDDANSDGVIKVYADWRKETDDDDEDFEYGEGGGLYGDENGNPIYDAVLYIYTNGKTSSYAKKVSASSLGKHTKDGVLSRDEVELVVENYFKTYDDTKYYGLFTKYYWNEGNYLTENAKYEIELDPDETTAVYVMVKNAKAYVADSSNPKTGDNIMIAVTTMGLTAAALVSLVELKKRKMI